MIGSDSYQHADPLGNARADARAVADALSASSFKVTLKQDVGLQAMKEALRTFQSEVAGGDEVVFYYAGHGVQLDSRALHSIRCSQSCSGPGTPQSCKAA